MNSKTEQYKQFLFVSAGVFLAVSAIVVLIAGLGINKRSGADYGQNTITVTGTAEVNSKPDIAVISYSLRGEGKTSKEAEAAIVADIAKLSDALKAAGIKEDDIKTDSHTVNPKYEYKQDPCTRYSCPAGQSVLVGYEVLHNETIKVRDLTKASDFLAIITESKVYSVNGPELTIEDPNKQQQEAREKAIEQARENAKKLSKSLGVKLGKLVSFSENSGGGYPMPMYAAKAEMAVMSDAAAPTSAPINIGTETTTADVTLVFKIK